MEFTSLLIGRPKQRHCWKFCKRPRSARRGRRFASIAKQNSNTLVHSTDHGVPSNVRCSEIPGPQNRPCPRHSRAVRGDILGVKNVEISVNVQAYCCTKRRWVRQIQGLPRGSPRTVQRTRPCLAEMNKLCPTPQPMNRAAPEQSVSYRCDSRFR